jgi:hypothetical protein
VEIVRRASAGLFADIWIVTVSPILYVDLSVVIVIPSGGPTCNTVSDPDPLPESAVVELVAVTVNEYVPGQKRGVLLASNVNPALPDPAGVATLVELKE